MLAILLDIGCGYLIARHVRKLWLIPIVAIACGVAISVAANLLIGWWLDPVMTQREVAQRTVMGSVWHPVVVAVVAFIARTRFSPAKAEERTRKNTESAGGLSGITGTTASAPPAKPDLNAAEIGAGAATLRRISAPVAAWVVALGALAIALSVAFPPWVIPVTRSGVEQRLGYGTFFSPPRAALVADTGACGEAGSHELKLAELRRDRAVQIDRQRTADAEAASSFEAYERGESSSFILRGGLLSSGMNLPPEQRVDLWIEEARKSLGTARESCETTVSHRATLARIDYARLALQIAVITVLCGLAILVSRMLRAARTG